MKSKLRMSMLLVPATVLEGLFFLIPLTYLFLYSFYQYSPTEGMVKEITLENYYRFFSEPAFRQVLWVSFKISVWVTLVCIIFGYPVAYHFARSRSKWRGLLLIIIVSPLFISPIIRTFGLQLMMADGGLINQLIKYLQISINPIRMMFTEGAVVYGLAIVNLSFMILSLSATIRSINPSLEEAAMSLGAGRVKTFLEVTFPLSIPGLLAGSILVFINGIGAYVTPILLGGTRIRMMVVEIFEQFNSVGNWPFGAAVSFILLFATLLMLVLYSFILNRSMVGGSTEAKGGR